MFKISSTKFISMAVAASMLTLLLAACVSQQAAATTPLTLIFEPDNPYPGCEWSLIMDGDQMDAWYASWPSYQTLYYTYADKSDLGSYAAPEVVLEGIRFPTVIKNDDTYYCFTSKPPGAHDGGGIFLYSSDDKTTWTPMNDGNAVMAVSENPTSQWYCMWNPGVVVVDGVFHIFVECGTQTDQSDVRLAYSHSTLEAMEWDTNRTESTLIADGLNACPIYVPERNSILMLYCTMNYAIPEWHVTAAYASMEDDLSQTGSWIQSPTFSLYDGATNTADAAICEPGASAEHDIALVYFHMQTHTDQGYYDGVNLTAFFDRIVLGSPVTITSSPVLTGSVNISYSYQVVASGTGITYSVDSDAAWLSIDPATGLINGTPTAVGTFYVHVTATSGDYNDYQNYSLKIDNLGWIVGVTDLIWSVFPIFLMLMFLGIIAMALRRRD